MESDAILIVDAESLRLLDANRAAESLWGYGRAELLTMTAADLSAESALTRSFDPVARGPDHIPLRFHRGGTAPSSRSRSLEPASPTGARS
jgi:PAS domain-containing protein